MYNWQEHEWKTRTSIIAKLIPPQCSILDMGGGKEHLKKYLRSPKLYRSVDVVKCTKDTVVADFNKNEYPDFKDHFDVVVAQGLIEYLDNPLDFFIQAKDYSSTLVVSYLETGSREAEEKGRVTFITLGEFRKLLAKGGWGIIKRVKHTPNHHIYLCRSVG